MAESIIIVGTRRDVGTGGVGGHFLGGKSQMDVGTRRDRRRDT